MGVKRSRRDDIMDSLGMMEDGEAPFEDDTEEPVSAPPESEAVPEVVPEIPDIENGVGPVKKATGMMLCADSSSKGAKVLLCKPSSGQEWELPNETSGLDSNEPGEVGIRRVIHEAVGLTSETLPICHLLSREGDTDQDQHSVFLLRVGDGKEAEPSLKPKPGVEWQFFSLEKLPEDASNEVRNCVLLVKDAAGSALVGWTAPFNGQAGEWKVDWETLRGLFWHCEGENRFFFEWEQSSGTLFEVAGVEGQRHPVWCLSEPKTNEEIWAAIPVPPTDPGSTKEEKNLEKTPAAQTGSEALIAKLTSGVAAGVAAEPASTEPGKPAKKARKDEALDSLDMADAQAPLNKSKDDDDDEEVDWFAGDSSILASLGIDEHEKVELPSALPEEERKPSAADLELDMFGNVMEDDAEDAETFSILGPQRPMNLAFEVTAEDVDETASNNCSPAGPSKAASSESVTAAVSNASDASLMPPPMAPPKVANKSKKPPVPAFSF